MRRSFPSSAQPRPRSSITSGLGFVLATLLAIFSFSRPALFAEAIVATVSVGNPPGALAYWSYGLLQVNWTCTSCSAATGFRIDVRPLDQTDDFSRCLMADSQQNPWIWDNADSSSANPTPVVSGASVTIQTTGGSVSLTGGRGSAPYLYRKIPEGGIFEVSGSCDFGSGGAAQCGLVVFNAGQNRHLAFIGNENGQIVSEDYLGSSSSLGSVPAASVMFYRAEWDEANKRLTTSAASTAVGLQSPSFTRVHNFAGTVPEVFGGDLWFGVAVRSKGGSGTYKGTFTTARMWRRLPAVKPPTVTGTADMCFSKSNVQAESVNAGPNDRSVTIKDLSQNWPYSVTVTELQASTSQEFRFAGYIPPAYARPMPPRYWALGAWFDARPLRANTPVTGVGTAALTVWPDTSGNGHHLRGISGRRPSVGFSQYNFMNQVGFDRRSSHYMSGGGDMIDFGGAGQFSVYTHTLLYSSSPAIIAGRGINTDVATQPGWAVMEYSDFWDPWPGQRGVRVTDRKYNLASIGFDNLQRWGYLYQTNHWANFVDSDKAAAASPAYTPSIYPFAQKTLQFGRSTDYYGVAGTRLLFPGFPSGTEANFTSYKEPVLVDWTSGSPNPPLTDANINFKIGAPINPSGDPFRSLSAQVMSVMTYREAHGTADRDAIMDWTDFYQYRRCYPIFTDVSTSSPADVCKRGYRDDYCYQGCKQGFAQTAGTNDHWCQGGRWSGAPAVCKKSCPSYSRPNFIKSCSKTLLRDDFSRFDESWNRYVVEPFAPDVVRDLMWNLDTTTGTMKAFTNDVCKGTFASHMGMHPNRWDLIIAYGGLQVTTARVRLENANSVAGLSVHYHNDGYNYLIKFNRNIGVQAYRNTNTLLAQDTSLGNLFPIGQYFQISFAVINLYRFTVSLGNTTIFTFDDNINGPASGPSWGASGMWADGSVSFQNFSITGDCDGGGNCVALSSGQSCRYACDTGYTPVTNTSGLVSCTDNGILGSMVCLTVPPEMPPVVLFIREHTTAGTAVGRVVATPANPRQQIDYSIIATYPREFNQTFEIGSCSGMILVKNPDLILYRFYRNITVTVKARPDTDEIGARITNHTIVIVDVDMPPFFTPMPQVLNVPENFRGNVGAVSTFDEDDDILIYSILSGNEGNIGASGTSTGIFVINPSTGNISTNLPLDFESQSSFSLLVQASEQKDRSMLGTGLITVNVLDRNDRPIFAPNTFFIDESVIKLPAAANMVLTSLECYDLDNNTAMPQWSQLDYAIVSNAKNGSTNLFSLDTSSMPPRVRLTQSLVYTYEMGDTDFGALKVRGVYTANMSVCDNGTPKLCAYAPITMVVVANYSAPLRPLIRGMPKTEGFDTLGNEPVTFNVRDFGEVTQINASYCGAPALSAGPNAGVRCYNATGCNSTAVINVDGTLSETVTCYTVPGWGSGLVWSISVMTVDRMTAEVKRFVVPVVTGLNLAMSYCDPILNSVEMAPNSVALDTSGGATFILRGKCFGPGDVDAAIQYGLQGEFSMERLTSQHTVMTARILPGCGANLPVRIRIGASQFSRSTNEDATKVTFPPPFITNLMVTSSAALDNPPYTLNTYPTSKSKPIILRGTNFGPATISGVTVSPVVFYQNNEPNPLRYNAVLCTKQANTAHNTVECNTSPGVGAMFNWTIQVCGQTSAPSMVTTSYRPPVVTDVRGAGKIGASTQGGQRLSVIGKDIGYAGASSAEMDRIVRWVRYGPHGNLKYQAENCRVMSVNPDTSDGTIDCLTTEGTGKNHSIAINVGGQVSNTYLAGISYGEPVIAAFDLTRVAQTPGGELIEIQGVNFGNDISVVSVFYTDRPTVPRAKDGIVPGNPPGQVTFQPRSCEFKTNHTSLLCVYNEGAGRKLIWSMIVDTQASASPSTKYDIPAITGIDLLDGVTKASTRGGTRARLTGSNFGLAELVQSVRFGPTGREYTCTNFTLISHFEMLVTLPAGIGQNLRFMLEVSDQSSEPSTATFDYATPTVFSVSPNSAVTDFDPRRPLLIEIRGKDFGLLDPASDALIGFGNMADRTLGPLIRYTSRYPPADEVAAGTFRPTNPNYEEILQFYLPESLGQNRSVRVVPYRRGNTPTPADVAALPVEGMRDVFNFRAPKIKYANVDGVTEESDKALLVKVFPDITITNIPQSARKIAVNGDSFGPPQSTDIVQRILEAREGVNSWSECGTPSGTCLVNAVAANWTHNKIIAFSRVSSATIRIRWVCAGPNGELSEVVSDPYTFSDVSPRVQGLVDAAAGYHTQGGEWLTVRAAGLASTLQLNVTVGGREANMFANEAVPLFTPLSTVTLIKPNEARDRLITKQGAEPFPPEFVWSVLLKVPEGEGTNQPVVLIRDNVYSGDAITINYIPPAITQVGYYDVMTSSWKMQPFDAATPLVIPTDKPRLRLIGTDMGVCPSMRFATDRPFFVDRCPRNAQNEVSINTNVTRSHTQVDFDAPEGEGTGLGIQQNGWSLEYLAGQQSASTGLVLLRYMPPTVLNVSPATGPTRGGTVLTISGANFGYKSAPVVLIGSDALGWKACLQPVRLSHTLLTCTAPPGVGANLQVRVTVAFQTGTGGSYSYVRPAISTVSVSHLAMTAAPETLSYSQPSVSYKWMTTTTTYSGGTTDLTADPAGGAVVTLVGSNFGPGPVRGASCIFSLWSSVLRQAAAPRAATLNALKCDGQIDLFTPGAIGEGEIKDDDIVSWTHEKIVFKLPAGQGRRKFTVLIGNQLPLPDMLTPARRELQQQQGAAPSAAPTPAASPSASPAPLAPANTPEFSYLNPVLIQGPPLPKTFKTKGGDTLVLYGRHFPVPAVRFDAASVPVSSVNNTASLATSFTVVMFGDRCITDARDWKGKEVMGLSVVPSEASATTDELKQKRIEMVAANLAAGCRVVLNTGPLVITPRKVNEHSMVPYNATTGSFPADNTLYNNWGFQPDTIEVKTPPGIGVNRTITVRTYDFSLRDGQAILLAESNNITFNYAPPVILRYTERRIAIRQGLGSTKAILLVDNVGTVEDIVNMNDEEKQIVVTIDGRQCVVPEKDYSKPGAKEDPIARYSVGDTEFLSCQLDLNDMKVGFKDATLRIAGQEGSLPANNTRDSFYVVCNPGLFGLPNETCLPCPIGGQCDGWVQHEADRKIPIGSLWGSSYYDGYGIHTPAIPTAAFYNLNGTQASVCPPAIRNLYPDRDVCIVGCIPKDACLGNNTCSDPYISKAPSFRCAACNRGYYRRGIECIPCPSHPELVIVGVLCLLIGVAGLGYYLNRAKINIAMFSIGVDYFQVLAIFAQSDVKWPPEIKELYHLLSIFNLNIEIVAPECLVPDVSYIQKWTVIMLIPIGVYTTLLMFQGANILYRIFIKGMKRSAAMADAGQVAMSSLLTIAFLMYIYLCRNIFDIMTCTPVEPDDGQTYIKAAGLEPCGKPGGVQLTLLPWAVIFMLLYVVGYPAALTFLFVSKRRLIMEDQLLRTRDQGDDPLTNPHALAVRKSYSRAYYAFKPHLYFWNLAILSRKLGITITFVVFAQNPYFQLAASLLVCFLAYAAQVRFNPYMPPQEFDEVYADHQLKSLVHGSIDSQLAASLKEVFAKAKKAGRRNDLQLFRGDERVVFVASWIFNNNTVEACLLFSAVLVNLFGLMYASIEGTAYAKGQKAITVLLIIVISSSIIYFISALFVEIRGQCKARAARRDEKALAQQRANQRDKTLATSADVKRAAYESATRQKRNSTKLAINPMFTNSGKSEKELSDEAAAAGPSSPQLDQARQAIFGRTEAPDASLWKIFQEQYADVLRESGAQTKELNTNRGFLRRAMDMMNVSTPEELIAAINKVGGGAAENNRRAKAAAGAPQRTRTFYKPQLTAGGEGGDDDQTFNPLGSTAAGNRFAGESPSGIAASGGALGSYNKMPASALKLNSATKGKSTSSRFLPDLPSESAGGSASVEDDAASSSSSASASSESKAEAPRRSRVSVVAAAPLLASAASPGGGASESGGSPMRAKRVSVVRPLNG